MKSIVLAGGCFWGVEAYLKNIEGVEFTEVGYANGDTISPTYEDVCNNSGHAEAVSVYFNSEIISTKRIVELFLDIIDPTSVNKQGNDVGPQYRSGIYWQTNKQEEIIESVIEKIAEDYDDEIAIEVMELKNFYRAEEEHQDYLDKNPNGYCHIPKRKLENEISA